jgi:hypothetical protein
MKKRERSRVRKILLNVDFSNPDFDPKWIFTKFWKYWSYLNLELKHPSFMTADVHAWMIYRIEYKASEVESTNLAIKLAILWYRCGFTNKEGESNHESFAQDTTRLTHPTIWRKK